MVFLSGFIISIHISLSNTFLLRKLLVYKKFLWIVYMIPKINVSQETDQHFF